MPGVSYLYFTIMTFLTPQFLQNIDEWEDRSSRFYHVGFHLIRLLIESKKIHPLRRLFGFVVLLTGAGRRSDAMMICSQFNRNCFAGGFWPERPRLRLMAMVWSVGQWPSWQLSHHFCAIQINPRAIWPWHNSFRSRRPILPSAHGCFDLFPSSTLQPPFDWRALVRPWSARDFDDRPPSTGVENEGKKHKWSQTRVNVNNLVVVVPTLKLSKVRCIRAIIFSPHILQMSVPLAWRITSDRRIAML